MNPQGEKVVFDCMIFVQALLSPGGPAGSCLSLCEASNVRLICSRTTLAEVRRIIDRPNIRKRRPQLTDTVIRNFIIRILQVVEISAEPQRRFPYPRDPDDEPYLNLAIAENADYLVSRDNDLLDLAKPDNSDGLRLRQEAPNLRIVDPIEFLRDHSS